MAEFCLEPIYLCTENRKQLYTVKVSKVFLAINAYGTHCTLCNILQKINKKIRAQYEG